MRRLRMGMVGGGPGAFIGPVHRIAAELDREIELVAGAFSSDAARSRQAGAAYRIDEGRAYPSLEAMIAAEAERAEGIDFVAIVTPNHLHLPGARAALKAGLPVISDKPATATLDEALELRGLVAQAALPYGLTYTYTGYPLVREARARVRAGGLGPIRKVVVEYAQGWLGEALEKQGNKQAEWRADPARAGLGGCIGDIGVHAFNLAEFVAGEQVTELLADLNTVVPGRALDDDCNVLLRFANGAPGVLTSSQVATGERNGLRLRVYGEVAGLEWRQEEPNALAIHHRGGTSEIVHAGAQGLSVDAMAATRLPAGHPEGYLEAFANLYRDFAALVRGETGSGLLPGIEEGVRGMAFVTTALEASAGKRGWLDLKV